MNHVEMGREMQSYDLLSSETNLSQTLPLSAETNLSQTDAIASGNSIRYQPIRHY